MKLSWVRILEIGNATSLIDCEVVIAELGGFMSFWKPLQIL